MNLLKKILCYRINNNHENRYLRKYVGKLYYIASYKTAIAIQPENQLI